MFRPSAFDVKNVTKTMPFTDPAVEKLWLCLALLIKPFFRVVLYQVEVMTTLEIQKQKHGKHMETCKFWVDFLSPGKTLTLLRYLNI